MESETETTKLSSKINLLNKNVKVFMFSIDKFLEKLDNTKPIEKTPEEEKERVGKIWESRGVGRPRGDQFSKREQYLKMLHEKKIKMPKDVTPQYTVLKRTVINMY